MLSNQATERLRERLTNLWGEPSQKVFEAWVREIGDDMYLIAQCFERAEKVYKDERPSPKQFLALGEVKQEKEIDRSVGLEHLHKMQEMGK